MFRFRFRFLVDLNSSEPSSSVLSFKATVTRELLLLFLVELLGTEELLVIILLVLGLINRIRILEVEVSRSRSNTCVTTNWVKWIGNFFHFLFF